MKSPSRRGGDRPLLILTHPDPRSGHQNSTPRQLARALPPNVKAVGFSWRRALAGRYDVLHVHWPEHLVKRRASTLHSIGVFLLLALTRIRRIPRIWTVHNLEPHEGARRLRKLAINAFQRSATARVYLYDVALPASAGRLDVVIPRGLQAMPELAEDGGSQARMGFLFFGRILPYKGIETLIDAYRQLPDNARPPLVICGQPADRRYANRIEALARDVEGVTVELGWLTADRLADRIRCAQVAVLPYRRIYNSGVVLNALTLDCPVLVRSSPTMRELQSEVGGDWVMTFDTLTPSRLADALDRSRCLSCAPVPDLKRRDWHAIGIEYAALYRRAYGHTQGQAPIGGEVLRTE